MLWQLNTSSTVSDLEWSAADKAHLSVRFIGLPPALTINMNW
jgi:hypothetical protein